MYTNKLYGKDICPRAAIAIKILPDSINLSVKQLADTLNVHINHISGTNHHMATAYMATCIS